jgi:8-oxo-dGTP pyrophosphatase MutT (NUDIX family)
LRPLILDFSPDWLRARLATPVPDEAASSWTDDAGQDLSALVPAAVLVGLIGGAHPGILLTKRMGHLRRHSGQVSFPGGRIDATDASPEDAALREAQEEVGLDPSFVELAGRLPDYITGTGYRVTPVVGVLRPGFTTEASPDEVESVFVLPLTTLLDPAAPQRHSADYKGRQRHYWVWPHAEHYIWGATAAMLVGLAARLRAP